MENRKNIVALFVATLGSLALAANADRQLLWENISALMTDSVAKNLEIENLIAASLISQHIPLHMLFISHTSEVLDQGNINVLTEIEKNVRAAGKDTNSYAKFEIFFIKRYCTGSHKCFQ